MISPLQYNDSSTLYKVSSSGYRGKKAFDDYAKVSCVFVQGTGFQQQRYQENVSADGFYYPDPDNDFVKKYNYRLEGMYIWLNPFNDPDSASWYKITECVVYRDHLLSNEVDNIQCRLKKTTALPTVS